MYWMRHERDLTRVESDTAVLDGSRSRLAEPKVEVSAPARL